MVIHDVIRTNARLHRIRLMDTDNCTQCRRQDTMLHRLTECGVGQEIWEWTRTRIARIQRTDRRLYPRNGSFVPVCNCGPDKDIRRYCGLWRMWFFYLVHQRRRLSVRTILTSCFGRDGRHIRIQIGWNPCELTVGVLSRLHLHHVPAIDPLHRSLQLYFFFLPYLPTVIFILILSVDRTVGSVNYAITLLAKRVFGTVLA